MAGLPDNVAGSGGTAQVTGLVWLLRYAPCNVPESTVCIPCVLVTRCPLPFPSSLPSSMEGPSLSGRGSLATCWTLHDQRQAHNRDISHS